MFFATEAWSRAGALDLPLPAPMAPVATVSPHVWLQHHNVTDAFEILGRLRRGSSLDILLILGSVR